MTTQYRLLDHGKDIPQAGDEYFDTKLLKWIDALVDCTDCRMGIYRRPIKGVIIDLPQIYGYEYTGEYRAPKKGECYSFSPVHSPLTCGEDYPYSEKRFILRKIEKPKTYRPFKDYEEMKPHRERLVHFRGCSDGKPLWYEWDRQGRNELFDHFVFEDTGLPVGVER